jgi:hypothetical protein
LSTTSPTSTKARKTSRSQMTSIPDSSILAALARTHRLPSPCAGKQPPHPLEERVAQRWDRPGERTHRAGDQDPSIQLLRLPAGQRAPKKR